MPSNPLRRSDELVSAIELRPKRTSDFGSATNSLRDVSNIFDASGGEI